MRKMAFIFAIVSVLFFSCDTPTDSTPANPLVGTWETTLLTGNVGQPVVTTERMQFTETECHITYTYPQEPPDYPIPDVTAAYYYNDSDIFFLEPLNYPVPYIIKNDLLYVYIDSKKELIKYTPVR
jgi:hypothetical protein